MKCPKCGSDAAYRNGHNTRKDGTRVEKIYCPTCGKNSQVATLEAQAQAQG